MEENVDATSQKFLAMKPPPFPMASIMETTSSEGGA